MRAVVVADTHLRPWRLALPPAVVAAMQSADCVLHAGDLTCVAALEYLQTLAPVQAVRGNVDDPEVRALLPKTRVVQLGGLRIGLVHGDGVGGSTLMRARAAFASKDGPRADCVVFGHSHVPSRQWIDGVLYLNPGSPTDPRRSDGPAYAVLTTHPALEAEIVWV